MSLPTYATTTEKLSYGGVRIFSALVLLFLIAPILVIMPLSFNPEPYFSYPLSGISLRWYEEFFLSERWLFAIKNSMIIAIATTIVSTFLGTLAALGLTMARIPGRPDLAAHCTGHHFRRRNVLFLCSPRHDGIVCRDHSGAFGAGDAVCHHHGNCDPFRV